MLYLSQVLSRPIRDLEGERVATIKDVIVRLGEDDHPALIGVVARYRRRDFFVSRWRITEFNEHGIRLNSDILDRDRSCAATVKCCSHTTCWISN